MKGKVVSNIYGTQLLAAKALSSNSEASFTPETFYVCNRKLFQFYFQHTCSKFVGSSTAGFIFVRATCLALEMQIVFYFCAFPWTTTENEQADL